MEGLGVNRLRPRADLGATSLLVAGLLGYALVAAASGVVGAGSVRVVMLMLCACGACGTATFLGGGRGAAALLGAAAGVAGVVGVMAEPPFGFPYLAAGLTAIVAMVDAVVDDRVESVPRGLVGLAPYLAAGVVTAVGTALVLVRAAG